jgi:hypothetical protein
MRRNFALLQIVGKEQEYVQTASETPELLDVPVHPLVPKTFPPDSTHERLPEQQERDQQPLRFEMEGWQLEELTKLMRGVFPAPGVESNHKCSPGQQRVRQWLQLDLRPRRRIAGHPGRWAGLPGGRQLRARHAA